MKEPRRWKWGAVLALILLLPGWLYAQQPDDLKQKLIRSYDLIEEGRLEEAKQLYREILQEYQDNPLALNNLAAIMVKERDYPGAMAFLNKALPRAKGYRVKVDKVCEVEGICLAFRPFGEAYGEQDLEPLIRLNLELLKHKMAAEGKGR